MTDTKANQQRVECIGNWLLNVSASNKRAYAEYLDSESIDAYAYSRMPSTEPISSSIARERTQRRNQSPPKKRKVTRDESNNCDAENNPRNDNIPSNNNNPSNDNNFSNDNNPSNDNSASQTPSQGIAVRSSQQSLPPSSASSAGLSRKLSRRASPVKKKQALLVLEKPILFNELYAPKNQLPFDVQSLYHRIRNISYYHSGYLPPNDRVKISSAVGEEIPDYSFKKPAADDVREAANDEFNSLQEILFESYECQKLGRSELALNMLVHAPLLKLALKNHHYVDEELVQSARICSAFMPPLANINDEDGKVIQGKMVDIALVLTPAEDGSRALGRNPKANKHDTSTDKKLLRAIQSHVLQREPIETQSINQTTYTPIMFRPIATSIETKAAGGSEEGKLQLGIWTSAWHRRMVSLISLFEQRGEADGQALWAPVIQKMRPKIITLPLILILGNDWRLIFACDRGDSLELLGEVPIGDTSTLLGLYTIVAVLHELADWIEGTFRKWVMRLFLQNGDDEGNKL